MTIVLTPSLLDFATQTPCAGSRVRQRQAAAGVEGEQSFHPNL